MKETRHPEALKTLEETFGDRLQRVRERARDHKGVVASVTPRNAEEIQSLAEIARRYSISLVPLGAGTDAGVDEEGSVLVRFDLMRRTWLPGDDGPWVETEPGTTWLELEEALSFRGRDLAVYPTSAPRATVGGWLATDGLGVGSFEYGWLSENVLSADVVSSGGELRTVQGEDLQASIGPTGDAAIVVSARLRTRVANSDILFAVAFGDSNSLVGAVTDTIEAGAPLWHLAFLDPAMARARGLGKDYLLFGVYPRERSDRVEEGIRRVAEDHKGSVLPTAGTHRVWTERFFPVAPAHPTPNAERAFVGVSQLSEFLFEGKTQEKTALQGTIARSKEALLLTFELDV